MIRSPRILAGAAVALVLVAGAAGARQYRNAGGQTESLGVVIETNDQPVSNTNPLGVMTMPFIRSTPDPIIFDGVTTTPKQFVVSKPPTATTYRFVNPCDVDVRIRRVGSMAETVTLTTGIRYLARTSEVVGTSNPSFVSIMAVSPPSAPCAPELLYGNGS
ncbi:hypothetical protein [Methylobacterium aquaticum]|uniref:Uncharacterized protein n=1 Tax=Methylobacterium aquaticum TaxID=270351 RepID=A0A0C6FH38_9HYPH|nr:hypothetical protein [Methylobacterium aquaticum]BAQ44389.1 hypothetical protein Maq22A_c04960 [Methylobacterium aquaticum]